jgi:radical SAM protein with 4Fe4S-binding SPASM domain
MQYHHLFQTYPVSLLSRAYCRFLLERCPECGGERLSTILDSMAGVTAPLCTRCSLTREILKRALALPLVWEDVLEAYALFPLYRRTIRAMVSGIAFFGPRIPQPTGSPWKVTWNVTNKCNLRCLHCYVDSAGRKSRGELDTKDGFALVDKMADAGVAIITLSGGEPLLRKDVYKIARRARGSGIYVRMETSGTLIDRKTAKKLAAWGVRAVDISLDGGVPKTHDTLRQKPGCFMQASEGISNCAGTGSFDDVAVTMTLTGKNWKEVAIAYDQARRLRATSFHVSALLPLGRGRGLRMPVTHPQRVEVMRFLHGQLGNALEGRGPLPLTKWMPYYTRFVSDGGFILPDPIIYFSLRSLAKGDRRFEASAMRTAQAFTRLFGACTAGISSCGLSPEGFLLPCAPSGAKLGNLKTGSLQRAWLQDKTLSMLRDRKSLKGKCRACIEREICGGSRIQAFASGYDWMETDPGCPY